VGNLAIDYDVTAAKDAVVELTARVSGFVGDKT
jgi:hypothetical protein